jgi:20S proteasome subunit alpha 7
MSMGYDFSCATLSQEGRIYQLEYAAKAVETAPTCMGIVCSDGVILASEKIRGNKTIVSGSNPTIYSITPTMGIAVCGYLPDGRNLVTRAREEAKNYLRNYGVEISGKLLADRLSYYVQSHTMYGWALRPFGAVAMISSWDKDGLPHLFMVETSGECFEYFSCCNGKGRQYVKTEVEKNDFALKRKTLAEALPEVVKILVKSYEGEKETEYDISIISNNSKHLHEIMSYDDTVGVIQRAKTEVEEDRKMQVD